MGHLKHNQKRGGNGKSPQSGLKLGADQRMAVETEGGEGRRINRRRRRVLRIAINGMWRYLL